METITKTVPLLKSVKDIDYIIELCELRKCTIELQHKLLTKFKDNHDATTLAKSIEIVHRSYNTDYYGQQYGTVISFGKYTLKVNKCVDYEGYGNVTSKLSNGTDPIAIDYTFVKQNSVLCEFIAYIEMSLK